MAVVLRSIDEADPERFLDLVRLSAELHAPWVRPPDTRKKFAAYRKQMAAATNFGYLVCVEEHTTSERQPTGPRSMVGVVNLTNIIMGNFCSGYLGYYAFIGAAGRGLMTKGLSLVAREAFQQLGLHRLEANIQPENHASIALARRCGFELEGLSRRYLKVRGHWRDHERWALVKD